MVVLLADKYKIVIFVLVVILLLLLLLLKVVITCIIINTLSNMHLHKVGCSQSSSCCIADRGCCTGKPRKGCNHF